MKTVEYKEIKRKIIRQWQCILQIDKLEIRFHTADEKLLCLWKSRTFRKQCNKRSSATCSICKKRGHLAKVLGKQKKFWENRKISRKRNTCSLVLFQLFRKSFARRKQWLRKIKLSNRGHWLYRWHYKSKECLWKSTSNNHVEYT